MTGVEPTVIGAFEGVARVSVSTGMAFAKVESR